MKIGHNLMAANAIRNTNANATTASKSMEKLSSGLAITTAADDAAGLAVSEKMKGQIRGLTTASDNAQDGVSMVQTADAALSETTSVLQRMRELANQASNDTNTTADRQAIQTETDQLVAQLDNIGSTTQFNTKNLLDGSLGEATVAQGTKLDSAIFTSASSAGTSTGDAAITTATTTTAAGTINLAVDGAAAVEITVATLTSADRATTVAAINTAIGASSLSGKVTASLDASNKIVFTSATSNASSSVVETAGSTNDISAALGFTSNGVEVAGTGGASVSTTKLTDLCDANGNNLGLQAGDVINLTGMKNGSSISASITITSASTMADLNAAMATMTGGSAAELAAGNLEVTGADGTANGLSDLKMNVDNREAFNAVSNSFTTVQAAQDTRTDSSLTMQIGANSGQTMTISIGNMTSSGLLVSDLDLTTATGAEMAITSLDNAIERVSSERAKLGAYQNRLESTINNLGTTAENLTSAQSSVTDVDMASEMSEFSKNNVLSQAAQAMLAQANQQPQQVLQLLQ